MPEEWGEEQENIYYKQLRDSENQLDAEIRSMGAMPEAKMPEFGPMIQHLSLVMTDLLNELRSQPEPDKVFEAALRGLNKMQQEQFLLENILESIKRGEPLPAIMDRFAGLGLISNSDLSADSAQASQPGPTAGEQDIETTEGGFLVRLRRKLGKSSMLLAKVAMNAARAAGKFGEIVPVIGFTGPIPTVSLQLQPKGASIDELLELVMDILE